MPDLKCLLSLALLAVFALAGTGARLFGHRARGLRVPDAPMPNEGARYEPSAHTPRANHMRRLSLWLGAVAVASFVAFAILVVVGRATCWPAL